MHLPVIRHVDSAYDARHLGTERSEVTANVSVIRDLFDLPAFPRIPVARDGDQNSQREKQYKNGSYVVSPPRTSAPSSSSAGKRAATPHLGEERADLYPSWAAPA